MYLSTDISTLQFGDGLMYTELLVHVVIRHLCQRFSTFLYCGPHVENLWVTYALRCHSSKRILIAVRLSIFFGATLWFVLLFTFN